MSGPSDKAVEAAAARQARRRDDRASRPDERDRLAARQLLDAAHDPALGLDASVCLRDVVEWLREHDTGQPVNMGAELEREFSS